MGSCPNCSEVEACAKFALKNNGVEQGKGAHDVVSAEEQVFGQEKPSRTFHNNEVGSCELRLSHVLLL